MGTITEDAKATAQWIARALVSSGYKADFTPQSLWEIERFFDEQSNNGNAVPGGLLAEQLGSRIFALGSYIGEVIRLNAGGSWIGDDSDPQAELHLELHITDEMKCWPIQRAMKRYKNGPEDSIAAYGDSFGLAVGANPKR